MNTRKSIILAAIGTAAFFYLGYLYSKLPYETHHKIYEISCFALAAATVFLLLFFIIQVAPKPKKETPTDNNDKNSTDINN